MAWPTPTFDIDQLGDALTGPGGLKQLAVIAGALAGAWLLVRAVRGAKGDAASVWFGARIIDGVLFPAVALAVVYAASVLMGGHPLLLRIALPILLSLLAIRTCVRVLGASFPQSRWTRVLERSISWLAWAAVVLWITGVLPLMLEAMDEVHWKAGSAHFTLRNLVEGVVTAGVVLVIALWIASAIERQLLRGSGDDLSLRKMAANIVRASLLLVGLIVGLSAVGIDLTALSVLGGALGVGIGFGLQKIAANYVSGFVILAERSVRIGDVVKVDNFEGRITDIRTRYTVIRSFGGRESIVPNEQLITSRVENASLTDRVVLVSTPLQVAYGTDVAGLQPKLVETMRRVPRVLADPAPAAHLQGFGADGLDLMLHFWIGDPENGIGGVRSELNLAVLALLEAEGVEIPFPQRVVHAPRDPLAPASPA